MANTYVKIATVTVGGGGAANMEFTSIPSTYTDLIIKMSARANTTGPNNFGVSLNNSTTGFNSKIVYGDGTSALSSSLATIYQGIVPGSGYTANTFGSADIYIPNYAGSTNKAYASDSTTENNATASYAVLSAALWSNTAAITSIKLDPGPSSSFIQYSTATLYGISKS
jgi:hypothetical protein